MVVRKWFSKYNLCVSMHVYMCTSLVLEWLDGYYLYSANKRSSIAGWCLKNIKIPVPRAVFQNRTDFFLKNSSNDIH
jgi:hypothetical protein